MEKELPQLRVPARHLVRGEQEDHRGPADRLVPPLVDEVNDDRQRDERQGDQEHRLKKRHQITLTDASARSASK